MVTAAINVLERINSGLFRMDDEVRIAGSALRTADRQLTLNYQSLSADTRHQSGRQGAAEGGLRLLLALRVEAGLISVAHFWAAGCWLRACSNCRIL